MRRPVGRLEPSVGASLPFIDVHLHLQVHQRDTEDAIASVEQVRAAGAELLVFYRTDVDDHLAERYAALAMAGPIPEVRAYGPTPQLFTRDSESWTLLRSRLGSPQWLGFFPQLVFPEQMTIERLERWRAEGCAGVKIVDASGEPGTPDGALGDEEKSRAALATVLAFCAEHELPVSVHADLRHHEGWIVTALDQHPTLAMNLAHFGHSRRIASGLLARWPDRVFTDVANLARVAMLDRDSYRRFMEQHADQVIFGSDAFLGDLGGVLSHRDMVTALLPESLAQRVLLTNPKRFLRI